MKISYQAFNWGFSCRFSIISSYGNDILFTKRLIMEIADLKKIKIKNKNPFYFILDAKGCRNYWHGCYLALCTKRWCYFTLSTDTFFQIGVVCRILLSTNNIPVSVDDTWSFIIPFLKTSRSRPRDSFAVCVFCPGFSLRVTTLP